MEFTELSLARKVTGEGEMNLPMKRKWGADATVASPSVDLHLQHPLPSDWEQCLDLQSGKMYYVNKKTSRKSWTKPQDQKIDLELNISTGDSSNGGIYKDYYSSSSSTMGNSNMVALACANCHLLVILSRSSPACPNCKYVHSLDQTSPQSKTSYWAM